MSGVVHAMGSVLGCKPLSRASGNAFRDAYWEHIRLRAMALSMVLGSVTGQVAVSQQPRIWVDSCRNVHKPIGWQFSVNGGATWLPTGRS